MTERVIYPNDKQTLALQLPTKRLILSGGIRAGKTLAGCIKIRDIALSMPGSQIMVMKNTLKEIRDDTWKILYNPTDGLLANTRIYGKLNKSNYEHFIPNGSKIIYRQGSESGDEKKLRGLDLSCIYFSQAENISKNIFEDALGRLTHWGDNNDATSRGYAYIQKYKSGEYSKYIAKKPAHFFIMDCNPDTGSWIYDDIIRKCPESIDPVKFALIPHVRYQFIDDKTKKPAYWDIVNFKSYDNSQLPEVTNWIAEQKAMTSDTYFRRMIEGEWVGSEGMIYSHFDNKHIAPNLSCPEFVYDKYLHEIIVSIDPGSAWYTGVVFMAYDKKTQNYIIFDEIKIKNTIISEISTIIKEKLITEKIDINDVKFLIDAAANAQESNGISKADQYRQSKIYVNNANKQMGLERINGLFKQNRIFIMGNCINLLRDIKSYAYNKDGHPNKKTGANAYDLADAFRYCINNYAYGLEITQPTPMEILKSSKGTQAQKAVTYMISEYYNKQTKPSGFGI